MNEERLPAGDEPVGHRMTALVEAGIVRSTMTEVQGRIDSAMLRRVHAVLEAGRARGKLVLEGF